MADIPLGPYPDVPLPSGPIGSTSRWGSWFSKITRRLGLRESGTVTFAGAATVIVLFQHEQPDTGYFIQLGGNSQETFWWTAKTVVGFVAHSSNAGSVAILNFEVSR